MMPTTSPRTEDAANRPLARRLLLVLVLLGLAATGALLWSAQADTPTPEAPADTTAAIADTTAPHRVLAYYFHTTKRCASCRKIEAYTAEAITNGFVEELKDGRLVFQALNLDEKENQHFAKDYQLFTKSVVLVEESDTTQVRWKNLPKVWELLADKEGFVRYVQEETRAYLTGQE